MLVAAMALPLAPLTVRLLTPLPLPLAAPTLTGPPMLKELLLLPLLDNDAAVAGAATDRSLDSKDSANVGDLLSSRAVWIAETLCRVRSLRLCGFA